VSYLGYCLGLACMAVFLAGGLLCVSKFPRSQVVTSASREKTRKVQAIKNDQRFQLLEAFKFSRPCVRAGYDYFSIVFFTRVRSQLLLLPM
jgi:hypothetical protein